MEEHGVVANYATIEDALKDAYHDASCFRAKYENRERRDLKNIAYQVKYVRTVGVYVYIAYVKVGIKTDNINKQIIEYFKTYPVISSAVKCVPEDKINDVSSTIKSTIERNDSSQLEDGRSSEVQNG